jgi:hypothetical protein
LTLGHGVAALSFVFTQLLQGLLQCLAQLRGLAVLLLGPLLAGLAKALQQRLAVACQFFTDFTDGAIETVEQRFGVLALLAPQLFCPSALG